MAMRASVTERSGLLGLECKEFEEQQLKAEEQSVISLSAAPSFFIAYPISKAKKLGFSSISQIRMFAICTDKYKEMLYQFKFYVSKF